MTICLSAVPTTMRGYTASRAKARRDQLSAPNQKRARQHTIASLGEGDCCYRCVLSHVPVSDALQRLEKVSLGLGERTVGPHLLLEKRPAHLIPGPSHDHRLSSNLHPFDGLYRAIVSSELAALSSREVVEHSSVVGASANDLGAILW